MVQGIKLYKNERITELGVEKRCTRCGDWWPADEEFFPKNRVRTKRGLSPWCKACFTEYHRERRGSKRIYRLPDPIPILR